MKLIVHLMTVVIVVFLFPPTSEGVRCYFCYYEEKGGRSGNTTQFNGKAFARAANGDGPPYDTTCRSSKPAKTTECGQAGCVTATDTEVGHKGVVRGCREPLKPKSGCQYGKEDEFHIEYCYCSTDLCNRSYALKYKLILMTVGFVTTISAGGNNFSAF